MVWSEKAWENFLDNTILGIFRFQVSEPEPMASGTSRYVMQTFVSVYIHTYFWGKGEEFLSDKGIVLKTCLICLKSIHIIWSSYFNKIFPKKKSGMYTKIFMATL